MDVSQSFLDAIDDNLVVINREGTMIYSNKAWNDFIEAEFPDHLSPVDNYFNFLHLAGISTSPYQLLSLFHGITDVYEHVYRCPFSRSETWFKLEAKPLGTKEKNALILISHTDITLSICMEKNAMEVIESMNDSFILLHEDNKIKFMNHKAEVSLHKKREDMLNQDIQESLNVSAAHPLVDTLEEVRETQARQTLEFYAETLNTWFEITFLPHKNGDVACFFQNINERKFTLQALREDTYFDSLTSLPNRGQLIRDMDELTRDRVPFTLVTVSIKDFQETNNLYGHEVADQLLKKLAFRLQKSFLEHRIYRYTGDEFLLTFEGTLSSDEMKNILEKLHETVEPPFEVGPLDMLSVSCRKSVVSSPKDGETTLHLLQAMDATRLSLKNHAKAEGDVMFYSQELGAEHVKTFLIKRDLLQSLDTEDLFLVYQPQVHGQTGEVLGLEVLSRWEHPEIGAIPPSTFISTAEKNGLITAFTLQLLKRGLELLRRLQQEYRYAGTMAFNISSSSLKDHAFIEALLQLPRDFQLQADSIELEITETMELTSDSHIPTHLRKLWEEGFRIALDDFGTGYSKISYLDQFPIHQIKVDRYFVQQIPSSQDKAPVLDALLELVRSVELELLIEGVERSYQLSYLLDKGCTQFQGYFFSRPLTEDELIPWLNEKRSIVQQFSSFDS
ncbi:sensor domain-containing protein [Alkalicoccus chagannorensis]|uniref:sensor domain-containing protein n=1 Tax=Alkalicoccus chagannorensis TaxID=427072 RepID=UPI0003F7766D|nr:EAL domain-containing protein [Alkalicoccus chagannorensis]